MDVCLEVSLLSQHLASPREGPIEVAYHIFACLKKHLEVKLVFNPTCPFVDESCFQQVDWTEIHGELERGASSKEARSQRCLFCSL